MWRQEGSEGRREVDILVPRQEGAVRHLPVHAVLPCRPAVPATEVVFVVLGAALLKKNSKSEL